MWAYTKRKSPAAKPALSALGAAFRQLVLRGGLFRGSDAWIRFERPMNGGPIVPWLEIKILDNPDTVSDTCSAPIKELEDDAGVELLFRRAWLALGTEAHGCKDGAQLRSVFEHLLANVARVEELLSVPEDKPAPFDTKRGTIAVPRRDALVN